MAYVPVGPFTDNTATPGVSASFLNGVETALVGVNPISPSVSVSSGGTLSIPLPGFSAGMISIFASSGGAWYTTYVGVYSSSGAGAMITQLATQSMGPGNAIASVTASTTSLNLTLTAASTGSNVTLSYVVQRATP